VNTEALDPIEGGTLLKLTAEIYSIDPEGFVISVKNSETNTTKKCNTTREYAEYIIESVNDSHLDNFVAEWAPSPHARKVDIDMIGMQLGMMQEWMEEELGEGNSNL
jgi:hypothetical protein